MNNKKYFKSFHTRHNTLDIYNLKFLVKPVLHGAIFIAATLFPYASPRRMFHVAIKEVLHNCDIVSSVSKTYKN